MLREDLRNGDLLFWRGEGFYSSLVRWATRKNFWKVFTASPYSHVGVFYRNGDQETYLDAVPGLGVRQIHIDHGPPQFALHARCSWSEVRFREVIAPSIGRPYSYRTAIFSYLGINRKGTSSFMCSEFSQWVLSLMGWGFGSAHYHPLGLAETISKATGNLVERIVL